MVYEQGRMRDLTYVQVKMNLYYKFCHFSGIVQHKDQDNTATHTVVTQIIGWLKDGLMYGSTCMWFSTVSQSY